MLLKQIQSDRRWANSWGQVKGTEVLSTDIKDYVDHKQSELKATGSKIEVKFHGNYRKGVVNGERNELLRIVDNLVSNSIKAADKVSNQVLVNVMMDSKRERVIISVADDCRGMAEGLRSRIFEKQVKGQDSTGYGLGLYYVKQTVDRLGGMIEVTSRVEVGTLIAIELPATFDKIGGIQLEA